MPRNIAQQAINQSTVDITSFGMSANDTQLTWFNHSRNPLIDQQIQPGPYKELLPCIDLCYEIVKSCPAAMGFGCPKQEFLYNKSYSIYDGISVSPPSCNFLGRDPPQMNSAIGRLTPGIGVFILVGILHVFLAWS
jgi:calcium channel MID1